MENKKSIQLSQAFGAVLTLVLVSVLVIVAVVIFVQLASSFAGTETSSIINESMAITDNVTTVAVGFAACGFTTWTPGLVLNATTDATLVLNTDYSVQSTAGTITNLTIVASPLQVTYDYVWGSSACNASESMTTEFSNYTSLIGLVGTIIFLGLVIGVLVTAFAFGGRREV